MLSPSVSWADFREVFPNSRPHVGMELKAEDLELAHQAKGWGKKRPLIEIFLKKIKIDEGDCWNWTGIISHGYGIFRIGKLRRQAHRVLYVLFVGTIDAGMTIDHLCKNKRCANPKHLQMVTVGENVRRALLIRTHCKHGHEYTPENTRIKEGARVCRTCHAIHTQRLRKSRG